ncbi:MAG: NEW3 domain-containing protein [Chloroflexota bacterium]
MSWRRVTTYFLCFVLLLSVFGGLVTNQPTHAAQEDSIGPWVLLPNQEDPVEDKIALECQFPIHRGEPGDIFEFEVYLKYHGSAPKLFDLTYTEPPPGWSVSLLAGFPEVEVPAIRLESDKEYPDRLKVKFFSGYGVKPAEPGNYSISITASSGSLKDTIELTAEVVNIPRYEVVLTTETERLSTDLQAGKETHLGIRVINTGSGTLEKLSLSALEPEGWRVTFSPDKVDSLAPTFSQEIDMVIEPPSKTIAGDYEITVEAETVRVYKRMNLRVTVLTSTIWGWVGIVIVLIVIAGLAVMFRRFGRR